VQITVGRHMYLPPQRIDAVVTQRGGTKEASLEDCLALVRTARHRRLPLIYDLDDDLLSRHPVPAVDRALEPRRPQARLLLREADLVIVSTAAMAERVRHINANVHVWPNALDDALIVSERASSAARAELLYMGTATHLPDLMAAVPVLEAGLAGLVPRPRMEVIGISDDARIGALLSSVCDLRTTPSVMNYARFLREMQHAGLHGVGIAPLAPHPFNRCKSDIKFLDYAVIGAAGIYTDSPVYQAVIPNETGLVVPLEQFGNAVRHLLDSPVRAAQIRATARAWVMEQRVLSRRAPDLAAIIERALDRAPAG
jgi:hypothetical protein